jgi:hypothetical protein
MMTRLQITYDPHALKRMKSRGITRQDVQLVLAHGVYRAERSEPGAESRHSRSAVIPDHHGQHEIKVVYFARENALYVITAMFTDFHRE